MDFFSWSEIYRSIGMILIYSCVGYGVSSAVLDIIGRERAFKTRRNILLTLGLAIIIDIIIVGISLHSRGLS